MYVERQQASKIYTETNRIVEKWSVTIHFYTVRVVPHFIIWLSILTSYLFYFTTELGNEAFQLPYPTW